MTNQRVMVRVDDRVRLMSALLAMTDWPEREQQRQPHGVHTHARATRRHLAQFADHSAVQTTQRLLDEGRTLEDLFTFSQVLTWPSLRARGADVPGWVPSGWTAEIRNFYIASKLVTLWKDERAVWDETVGQLETIFEQGDIQTFLTPYVGQTESTLVFLPNLSYPTLGVVCFPSGDEVLCICAPQVAVGTNPPWPFGEDPAWVHRVAFEALAGVLVRDYLEFHQEAARSLGEGPLPLPETFQRAHPDWRDQFVKIFVGAATAIFLEETVGKQEADAYIVVEHKAQGFDILPSAVSVLRRYLSERDEGRFHELADYLPVFRNHLRVAARMLR